MTCANLFSSRTIPSTTTPGSSDACAKASILKPCGAWASESHLTELSEMSTPAACGTRNCGSGNHRSKRPRLCGESGSHRYETSELIYYKYRLFMGAWAHLPTAL